MNQEQEQTLIRATLAALARRSRSGLVLTREEVDRELAGDTRVRIVFDKHTDTYRVSIPEVAL